jgi:hypothetical protein
MIETHPAPAHSTRRASRDPRGRRTEHRDHGPADGSGREPDGGSVCPCTVRGWPEWPDHDLLMSAFHPPQPASVYRSASGW